METASFLPHDPAELVQASLACPVCLRGDVGWWLDEDDAGYIVACDCRACGHGRRVGLTDGQALRLVLTR